MQQENFTAIAHGSGVRTEKAKAHVKAHVTVQQASCLLNADITIGYAFIYTLRQVIAFKHYLAKSLRMKLWHHACVSSEQQHVISVAYDEP